MRTLLQRLGGFEQRADLDVPFHAEQPGKPERGEQRVAGLGLGDQEAHRHRAVHVLDDLRHRHHQARGRCLLDQQRAEVDRHRLHRIERRVDRREQRAAMRRLLRRIGDRQTLAHDIVDLRGIEPRVRVRQRQPVRNQARARRAQRQPRRLVGGGQCCIEQRQQRFGRGQRGVAPVHQRLGEGGDTRRVRRFGTKRELRGNRLLGGGDARPERLGSWQGGDLAMQTRELQALHLQAQPQRVPPADIGAPVGVVADPARQDHRARREFRPAVGPRGAGDRQQRLVEPIDRVTAVGDRGGGLGELVGQRDRRRPVRRQVRHGGAPTRGLRQGVACRDRQRERRMRGEHSGEARALHQRAILDPTHRAVIRVGPQQMLRQTGQHGSVLLHVGATHVGCQPLRPVVEGGIAKMADQRGDVGLGQRVRIHAPADGERH